MRVRLPVLAAALWLAAASVAAQDSAEPVSLKGDTAAADSQDSRARALFEAGRTAYEAGDYESALTHFRQAYEGSQRPALLFNIGQAADRLRRNEEALAALEAYLSQVPDAPNREAVDNRIAILRDVVARERQAAAPAAAPTPVSTEPEPSVQSKPQGLEVESSASLPLLPLVVAGVGAVVLGVGAGVGAAAKAAEEDYAAAPVATRSEIEAADGLLSDARDKATLANVLLGVGGVVLVAGAAWLVVELSAGDDPVQAQVLLGPQLAGLQLQGTFGADIGRGVK